jgi:hypothetical protein
MNHRILSAVFIVLCALATEAVACDNWECPADEQASTCWVRYGPDAWHYPSSLDCEVVHNCTPGAGCTYWCDYQTMCYEV